jgi:hypothetical protein
VIKPKEGIGHTSDEPVKEKHMKPLVRSTLAAVAAGVALAGCATYDYGSGYSYSEPYYGYNYGYDNGPYSYDYNPYVYGPSDYVAPSIGFGFTYRDRDRDRGNYDRNYNWRRNNDSGHDNDYRRGGNDQWRGDHDRSRPMAPSSRSGREDPWGGTNNYYDPNQQQ